MKNWVCLSGKADFLTSSITSTYWKPLFGYEGLYEISDTGEVKSFPKRGRYNSTRILSQNISKKGYYKVNLYKDGVHKVHWVHRLVLLSFEGEPSPLKPLACHKDGNPANNSIGNLRWDDHLGNHIDREAHGKTIKGTKHYKSVLKEDEVKAIREYLKNDHERGRYTRCSIEFRVSPGAIRAIAVGDSWNWLK